MEFAPDAMTALVDMLKTGEEDSDSDEDKVNIVLLTLMVLEATFCQYKKKLKMSETQAYLYSSESTQQELSNK